MRVLLAVGKKAVHKRSRSDSQLHKLEARPAESGPTKVSPVKIKKFNTLLSQPVVDIGTTALTALALPFFVLLSKLGWLTF
jgi:hypothetical protein